MKGIKRKGYPGRQPIVPRSTSLTGFRQCSLSSSSNLASRSNPEKKNTRNTDEPLDGDTSLLAHSC